MFPIAAIIPLLPMLAQLGVRVADWLGGDDAEAVAQQVSNVVTSVAGTTDPTAVAAVLQDPSRAAEITTGLARIAAEREKAREDAITARLAATLADTANARQQTVDLTRAGSRMAWMPAVITFVLLVTFGAVLGFVFFTTIPEQNTRLVDQLIGGLYTLVTMSVSYWVGTSRGAVEMRRGLEQVAHNTPRNGPVTEAHQEPASSSDQSTPRRLFGGPRS